MKDHNTYNEQLGGHNLPESLRVNPFIVSDNFFDEQKQLILDKLNLEKIIPKEDNQQNVPAGYFDNLSNQILAKIAESKLKEKITTTGFETPDNYFEDFNENIQSKIFESNLKIIIPHDGFHTPENYFDEAQTSITTKIFESNLKESVTEDGFVVAPDYFSSLEENIRTSIFEQQLKESISSGGFTVPAAYFENASEQTYTSVVAANWKQNIPKDGFDIPTGYFEKLNNAILKATKEDNTTETPIRKMPFKNGWKVYAAAAITLFVGVGSYLFVQQDLTNNDNNYTAKTVEKIDINSLSDDEIVNYLAQVSEGEDLIQLSSLVQDSNVEHEDSNLNQDIENKELEEYLNYML